MDIPPVKVRNITEADLCDFDKNLLAECESGLRDTCVKSLVEPHYPKPVLSNGGDQTRFRVYSEGFGTGPNPITEMRNDTIKKLGFEPENIREARSLFMRRMFFTFPFIKEMSDRNAMRKVTKFMPSQTVEEIQQEFRERIKAAKSQKFGDYDLSTEPEDHEWPSARKDHEEDDQVLRHPDSDKGAAQWEEEQDPVDFCCSVPPTGATGSRH